MSDAESSDESADGLTLESQRQDSNLDEEITIQITTRTVNHRTVSGMGWC